VSDADRARWDTRYADAVTGLPAPPQALAEDPGVLPCTGRALDLACGRGEVSLWLALRGLRVDAVDVAGAALAALTAAAAEHGVAQRVRTVGHDLDGGVPDSCAGPYDAVVCQRFRAPDLYPALAERLAPGGVLVVTVLAGGHGPFRAAPGELRAAFGHLEVLVDREDDGVAHLVARRR
jgi:2-polyprenyl-3-methyl-5-hydroxy-6-metoxy-1,4-benzoquinol methylase